MRSEKMTSEKRACQHGRPAISYKSFVQKFRTKSHTAIVSLRRATARIGAVCVGHPEAIPALASPVTVKHGIRNSGGSIIRNHTDDVGVGTGIARKEYRTGAIKGVAKDNKDNIYKLTF